MRGVRAHARSAGFMKREGTQTSKQRLMSNAIKDIMGQRCGRASVRPGTDKYSALREAYNE